MVGIRVCHVIWNRPLIVFQTENARKRVQACGNQYKNRALIVAQKETAGKCVFVVGFVNNYLILSIWKKHQWSFFSERYCAKNRSKRVKTVRPDSGNKAFVFLRKTSETERPCRTAKTEMQDASAVRRELGWLADNAGCGWLSNVWTRVNQMFLRATTIDRSFSEGRMRENRGKRV